VEPREERDDGHWNIDLFKEIHASQQGDMLQQEREYDGEHSYMEKRDWKRKSKRKRKMKKEIMIARSLKGVKVYSIQHIKQISLKKKM
jgi:hypothetical protein